MKLYYTALNCLSRRTVSWKRRGPRTGRPGILPACSPRRRSAAFGNTYRRRGRDRSEQNGHWWWTICGGGGVWIHRLSSLPICLGACWKRTFRWRRDRRCTSAWRTCACAWGADTASCPGSRCCGPAWKRSHQNPALPLFRDTESSLCERFPGTRHLTDPSTSVPFPPDSWKQISCKVLWTQPSSDKRVLYLRSCYEYSLLQKPSHDKTTIYYSTKESKGTLWR